MFVPLSFIETTNKYNSPVYYEEEYSGEKPNPYGYFEDDDTFVVAKNAYLGFSSLPTECKKLVFEYEPYLMFSFGRTIYSLENLKEIEFKYDDPEYIVEDGAVYNKDKTILYALLRGNKNREFIVPDTVTQINSYAFAENEHLVSVKMNDNVTELGEYCFYNCSALRYLTLSDNIEIIPEWCFYDCNFLANINLPSNLKTVKQYGMADIGIKEITFPSGFKSIEKSGFERCRQLEKVEFNDSLEAIGDNAFNSCNKITSVVIPDSCVYLGRRAFSITDVTLPKSLK